MPEGEGLTLPLLLTVSDADMDVLLVLETDDPFDGVTDAVGVTVSETDPVSERESDDVIDTEPDKVDVALSVMEGEAEDEAEEVSVDEILGEGDAETVTMSDVVTEAVMLTLHTDRGTHVIHREDA